MTTIDVLETLESTSGSLAKREILEVNRKNELLKNVFSAAFDPYVVYYVSKFKMPKAKDEHPDDSVIEDFLTVVLPPLASRQFTGNAAKDWVIQAFSRMSESQQKWCLRILLHNLRCGVQESTVNKVWPGLIQSFSVALAVPLKSEFTRGEGIKILDKVSYPVRVEPKLDGLRLIAIKKNGEVTFYTRNGTVLESMPRIRAALTNAKYDNVVLDGEGMAADWNESSSVMMSGRGADSKSGKKAQKDDSGIFYNVFDAMPIDDWVDKETTLTYADRCRLVAEVIDNVGNDCVRQVPHVMVKNEDELKQFFAKCMNDGYEGVMLKRLDTIYEWDRSKNILKLKPCVTYEGVIVGWYQGRRGTKREGLFGGFRVVLPNGIVTRVGGGFNDATRAQIQLDDPETWIGRIVECEAQPDPLTPDGLTVDGKMRFPVYVRTRSEADVDPKVIAAGRAYEAPKSTDEDEEA